jgi:hypothetical protein
VGVREQSRDYSPAAEEAFNGPVPKELMDYLSTNRSKLLPELQKRLEAAGNKTSGTWTEVFGPGMATDETFQAWHYARYLETVAAAGKKEYPIPMYANCWLEQGGNPGDWPSGGPVAYLIDIWQAGAPSLDALAPDIYAANFEERCTLYHRNGNPLLIPEANTGASAGSNPLFVYGKMDGLLFSPFAVDRSGLGGDQAYLALAQLAPAILEHQGKGTIFGWILGGNTMGNRTSDQGTAGNYNVTVTGRGGGGRNQGPSGMIITIGPDEFYILQSITSIKFEPKDPAKGKLVVDLVEEGSFVNDKWTPTQKVDATADTLAEAISASYRNFHVKLSQKP